VSKLPDFLGPYRLARFIRSGNSALIYEAIRDDQRFVLKILRMQHWGSRAEAAQLKHEYEVAHKIEHPNVIRIYQFAVDGKISFLVLELFSDTNVKQILRERGLGILHVHFAEIAQQCASALAALHGHGWVHCDVKPDNYLMTDDAQIKLIDFTISQRITRGKWSSLMRKKRAIRGTRSYMSPEQIRNEALDQRADVYSLGCVLYELLSGKVPFTGSSPNDLLNKHLKAPVPSIQVHNNNVTDSMSELLRRMMAKTPEDRPATMSDVLKELQSIRPFKQAPKLDNGTSHARV
jgi:serine/threonine protein kinase